MILHNKSQPGFSERVNEDIYALVYRAEDPFLLLVQLLVLLFLPPLFVRQFALRVSLLVSMLAHRDFPPDPRFHTGRVLHGVRGEHTHEVGKSDYRGNFSEMFSTGWRIDHPPLGGSGGKRPIRMRSRLSCRASFLRSFLIFFCSCTERQYVCSDRSVKYRPSSSASKA